MIVFEIEEREKSRIRPGFRFVTLNGGQGDTERPEYREGGKLTFGYFESEEPLYPPNGDV